MYTQFQNLKKNPIIPTTLKILSEAKKLLILQRCTFLFLLLYFYLSSCSMYTDLIKFQFKIEYFLYNRLIQ